MRVCVRAHVSGGCSGTAVTPRSHPDPIGYDAQRAAGILNENSRTPPSQVTQQVFHHYTHKCYHFIRGFACVGACVYGGGGVFSLSSSISNDTSCVSNARKETHASTTTVEVPNKCMCVFCSPPPNFTPHKEAEKALHSLLFI